MVGAYSRILKNRNFFFLWSGQIISQFGERLSQMALIGLVYVQAPGSTLQLAKILSFTILPVFLIGPEAGVYVDRWNRRQTMFICDFLRASLVLLIPLLAGLIAESSIRKLIVSGWTLAIAVTQNSAKSRDRRTIPAPGPHKL